MELTLFKANYIFEDKKKEIKFSKKETKNFLANPIEAYLKTFLFNRYPIFNDSFSILSISPPRNVVATEFLS